MSLWWYSPAGARLQRRADYRDFAVVPANAGTHTPRRMLSWKDGRRLSLNNADLWLWVPCVRRDDPSFGAASKVTSTLASYCTLSATKRNSPSPFETRSSADFLPSFLS